MKTYPLDSIRDVKIGQAQDRAAATGCTVIICEKGAVCGVDVRGGSPVTRDTDALNPVNNRQAVHAVMLAGGSSFGLDAAGGVMRFLEGRGIGRDVGVTVVPNVCAAILFDLVCGSADVRPDAEMGYLACEHAFSRQPFRSGNFGAGTGATVGNSGGNVLPMKGGIGSAVFAQGDLYAGAVIAVNCVGDIVDSRTGRIVAGARTPDGKGFADNERMILEAYNDHTDLYSGNTIIGCIVTNAKLNKAQATKLAAVSHNGIARSVRPAHTIFDGDTLFTLCTEEVDAKPDAVGILACHAVEAAIYDGIANADTYDGYLAHKDLGRA